MAARGSLCAGGKTLGPKGEDNGAAAAAESGSRRETALMARQTWPRSRVESAQRKSASAAGA